MDADETDIFVTYVDGGWQPPLTEVQRGVWTKLAQPLDPKTCFRLILQMITRDRFRPAPPDFMAMYRRDRIDSTPTDTGPQARDEMPDWVRGWRLAQSEGDVRLWPEQEDGYRHNHAEWENDCGWDHHQRKKFELKSGYEWEELSERLGVMPQADRLDYITLAKSRSDEEALDAIMSGSPAG